MRPARTGLRRGVIAPLASLALLIAPAGCGDPVDPTPPATLSVTGPAVQPGTLVRPSEAPQARRFECIYDVRVIAGRTPFALGGATLTVQPWKGGDLPVATVHRFTAAEVADWLGTSTLGGNRGVDIRLGTHFTFVPTVDTFGDTGAHRATWAFAYGAAGDSARYQVECTAATEHVLVRLDDARTGGSISALPVTFDGQALRTSFVGLVGLPPLVAGRYRLRVADPLYAPLDTLIETGGGQLHAIALTRVRPHVESATGPTSAGSPPGGSVVVHHPGGVAALPADLPIALHDSSAVPARIRTVAATGTDVDASRRRFTFVENAWGTTHIVVPVPMGDGTTMTASCRRYTGGPWICADRWPAPGQP